MDPKKADSEVSKGVEVREIIAVHRAVRTSLNALWVLMLVLIIVSACFSWGPGIVGGSTGAMLSSVTLSFHNKKKIK